MLARRVRGEGSQSPAEEVGAVRPLEPLGSDVSRRLPATLGPSGRAHRQITQTKLAAQAPLRSHPRESLQWRLASSSGVYRLASMGAPPTACVPGDYVPSCRLHLRYGQALLREALNLAIEARAADGALVFSEDFVGQTTSRGACCRRCRLVRVFIGACGRVTDLTGSVRPQYTLTRALEADRPEAKTRSVQLPHVDQHFVPLEDPEGRARFGIVVVVPIGIPVKAQVGEAR